VDEAALKDAGKSGEEWISYNAGWSEQRFRSLNQVTASNINRLTLAWSANIPAAGGRAQHRQEGTPLVFKGVMYSIAPWSIVYAIDARNGLAAGSRRESNGVAIAYLLRGSEPRHRALSGQDHSLL
jgi:glucose dehydrogenase